ncbi:unnamed protein product [Protopolystoma xenopodis]|uniref:Calponin-homology (CH) domain-containing protein n=1 Tax=Protopolystoma xenopodis TaxID=117903 RepID=A0A448WKW3_9PLAT|nr:unnamed protein product [Protopolystoma xenopodis]
MKVAKRVSVHEEAVPCEDKDVLQWTNEQLKSIGQKELSGFRDQSLCSGLPVLHVLEAIGSGPIDRDLVTSDDFANCVFVISQARKCGARVYALPEHLQQLHSKMILTIFVCLMILHYRRRSTIICTE